MKPFYFALCLTGWQTGLAQPLTPAQIFAKTSAVYQSAATYQDSGEEITLIKHNDPHWYEPKAVTFKKTFQTAFVRRTLQYTLRYQRDASSRRPEKCSLIWAQGAETKTWVMPRAKVDQTKTLKDALLFSWGSPNAAARLYGLLMNLPLPVWSLGELKAINILPSDEVLNRSCYHLRGILYRESRFQVKAKVPRPVKGPTESHPAIDVWIDAVTYLIVRVTESYNKGTDYYTETINYQPVLNKPVKPEALAFNYSNCQ